MVHLKADAVEDLRSVLGDGCPADLRAVLVGRSDAGSDIIVTEPGCTTTRFVVPPDLAVITSAESP